MALDPPPPGRPEPAAAATTPTWMRSYRIGLVVVDLLAASAAAWAGYVGRYGTGDGRHSASFLAALALPLAWVAMIALNRAYEPRFIGAGQAEFDRVFRAFLHLTVVVAVSSYATHAELARGFVVIALPLAFLFDVLGRYGARKWLHRQRARGRATYSVLAVGDLDAVVAFDAQLRRERHAGMHVRGACVLGELPPLGAAVLDAAHVPVLGGPDEVLESARRVGADIVAVVSSSHLGTERLRWIAWQLEDTDIDLVVSPGIVEVADRRLHIRPVAGLPLVHIEQPEFRGFRRLLKGAFDRLGSALALLLLSPLLLALYVAIKLTSRGPAFFHQTRVGRDGRTFTMVKFRSMRADAEALLATLSAGNVYQDGPLFKLRDDPRITRVGRVLRKYSLDELPQLFNVLLGHMSLVGPRPPLPSEVSRYGDDVRRRLLVKPGLTGLWQVSGRNDLSWEESVRLDLRYVENWSPALDLLILWKTAFAVVRGSGAY